MSPTDKVPPQPANPKLRVVCVRNPIVFKNGAMNNEATPAIAFAYIASYLRKHGYATTLVDAIGFGLNRVWPLEKYPGYSCQGLPFDEILALVPRDADVVAFSGMFSGEWPVLRDLILEVRKRVPKALFVIGGEHATALPEYSLRDCPALDAVVRGEGEHTFYELLESYRETGGFENIAGVSFLRKNGEYVENGTLPRIRDAATIPWPLWPEGYMEAFWAAGKSYGVSTKRDMPFMSSRGCPYQCTFCSNPQMWTTRYVLRDPDDCIAEIKSYIERYDITSLQFYDLTAITKKGWIMDFGRKLVENGINLKWSLPSGTRSEVLDSETLALIKKTGCTYLVYAPESGSARTLKNIKKQIKLELLTESVKEAMRQGIAVRTNLIIGFPCESRSDVFKTLLYGLKMAALGVDDTPVFIFSPYPGSEIFRGLTAEGRVKLDDRYFFDLTSINGNYLSMQSVSYNKDIPAVELAVYRTIFILANYAISYLFYPSRILRTFRNVFTASSESSTVFEHRLKDAISRKLGRAPAAPKEPAGLAK